MIIVWFTRNLLGSYFYVIDISYDKTHCTYIWVDLSGFKMIISSGFFIYWRHVSYLRNNIRKVETVVGSSAYDEWFLNGKYASA